MSISRRDLLKVSGLGIAAAAVTGCTSAYETAAKPSAPAASTALAPLMGASNGKRVVVLGGGFGGLTVAKYLRKESKEIEVVVIDKRDTFMSCPYSNVWMGGVDGVTMDTLSRDFYAPAAKHGYKFVQATITGVDRASQTVMTSCGSIAYDYLVVAPGIEYDYKALAGDDKALASRIRQECPPALMPGSEHLALKRQMEEMEEGNFIITVPDGAYRCPPAPYERASMVAYYIKKNKLKAKVIIVDPRKEPGAKPKQFMAAWKELYPEIVEFHGNVRVTGVDLDKKILKGIKTEGETEKAVEVPFAVANIIPKNVAHPLMKMVGVDCNADGYAKVKLPSHAALNDPRIYVLGDAIAAVNFAAGSGYPKSGHMANAQGKIVAKQLASVVLGKAVNGLVLPDNTCFSMVNGAPKEAIVVNHKVEFVVEKDAAGADVQKIKVTAKADFKSTGLGTSTDEWLKGILNDLFA